MIEDVGWKGRIKICPILRSVFKQTLINHKQWHCLLFTGKYFLIGSQVLALAITWLFIYDTGEAKSPHGISIIIIPCMRSITYLSSGNN
jgi:hypothetical protein